ncbi:MAG: glycosyltransferase [Thermoanaerobaculia bacterium]
MSASLSVVIPTHDRRESLERVLDALELQRGDVPGPVEIIVVDDGSVDGTAVELARRAGSCVALRQSQAGPARARNRGAQAASGQTLLFLGDDTVPEPCFLSTHARAQAEESARGPCAVLGYTTWDRSRMKVTPLLRHLNERGLQFGFSLIEDPENVPFNFFYTSNVSMPRLTFLELGGFDETFPFAAWEDVEFAFRARRAAVPLRMVYRPAARVSHDHPTSLPAFRARQLRAGSAAAVFAAKHPEMKEWLGVGAARLVSQQRPWRLALLDSVVASLDGLGIPLPGRLYDSLFRWDYLSGLKSGLGPE